jgi:peptidoglycan-associated lipoprotein
MDSMDRRSSLLRYGSVVVPSALVAGLCLVLAACGEEKEPQAHAAAPPSQPAMGTGTTGMSSMGMTNMQVSEPPNTATAANVSIAPDVLRACNIPDADAYFTFDSARLASFDSYALDSLATCFTSGPMKGKKLSLVGHADPRGTPDYNVTLGQSRADAVAGYLKVKGLEASNVLTTSRGAMDATGREETGWAHDRRVDVTLAP